MFSAAGALLALLVTTSFPELCDCVENIPELKGCDEDEKDIYLSSLYNVISTGADCIAMTLSGVLAGYVGYVYSYLCVGIFTSLFGAVYWVVCGPGKDFPVSNPITQ